MLTIPFTYQTIKDELCDKTLVMYRNEITDSKYRRIGEIVLNDDHTVSGDIIDEWKDVDGIFYLQRDGNSIYRIDSLEVTNGVVHAMGESLLEAHSQYSKIVLSVKSSPSLGICISSHIDYYETTVPRLVRSLKRVGFSGDVIIQVASHIKRDKPLPSLLELDGMDVKVQVSKVDKCGFTGIIDVDTSNPYWLLLHDTCEVTDNFLNGIEDIDVGLNPDFILLAKTMDLGIYSSSFVQSLMPTIISNEATKIRRIMKDSAKIWIEGSDVKRLQSKDVYGMGVKRQVQLLETGIKKYVQQSISGARP